jgi:hypothetical protein
MTTELANMVVIPYLSHVMTTDLANMVEIPYPLYHVMTTDLIIWPTWL